jgi:hypothetical protein
VTGFNGAARTASHRRDLTQLDKAHLTNYTVHVYLPAMAESGFPNALAEARENLERLLRERQQLDIRIAKMEQVVAALRSYVEPGDDESATTGFTDAVRRVLKGTIEKGPLSPTQIREGMLAMGFELSRYNQPLATIHVVLKRLVKSTEAREIGDSESKRYWWASYGEPPRQDTAGSRGRKRVVPGRGESGKRR